MKPIFSSVVFLVASLGLAADSAPGNEPFDSLDDIKAYTGYKAASADLQLVTEGAKEGKGCVKAVWLAKPDAAGNGGIEKMFPATDFTGKTFRNWVKPLSTDTVGSVFASFHDANDKRAEMRAWHNVTDWKSLLMVVGAKGNANHYERDSEADLTRITIVRFYAITRQGGQRAEVLWDGFEQVKD
jgi:hypothetical protein